MDAMTRSADAAAVAAIPRAIAAAPEKGTVFPRQIYMPDLSDLYPPSALREEQQGRVHLKCTLAVAGTLKDCAVALSSGVAALDAAAFEVAKLARYSPKIVDRVPEESQVILPVLWMIME
ncbi:hypothetical protein BXU08_02735 [Sphingomonas sp. LM7]|nr:hypothetical protein BXU08_02735 [Sphingomonas sp. LM7]